MKEVNPLEAVIKRKKKRGFLVDLQVQLEKMGYPMKKQQLSEYLADDPNRRVEPKFSLGLKIVEAANRIPA